MEAITLLELNSRIKQVLKQHLPTVIWVTAEITELQLNRSGHCYLQLVDKRETDENPLATARATIWAFTFRTLQPYFETVAGRPLAKGMKVMLQVEVVFHELYGYSLNVKDIDPTYTIGDLERKRKEILLRLEKEGILHMNHSMEFPLLPKNIAVISSPTAAGLGDFMNQLENNPYHFRFQVKLFPAVMQGERTTESIIAALEQIYRYEEIFDAVVIIRGGGSQTDLSSFDTYDLAAHVAQFPLPVIAGIGHERDETLVDQVAFLRIKTPTAAATYLIDCFLKLENLLTNWQNDVALEVQERLNQEHKRQLMLATTCKQAVERFLTDRMTRFQWISQKIEHLAEKYTQNRLHTLEHLVQRLEKNVALLLERKRGQIAVLKGGIQQKTEQVLVKNKRSLELAHHTMKLVDPRSVLERGYTITRYQGKTVKHLTDLKAGDLLETETYEGVIKSEVKTL